MSPNDVKNILNTVGQISGKMDKSHLKKIQSILISAQRSNRCVFFKFMTLKCIVKYLINRLTKSENIVDLFSRQQIKSVYKILGIYNYHPTCALCGKIIDMSKTSENNRNHPDSPLSFSWDHIYPKSCGGSNCLSNMQPTHKMCNNLKSDKIFDYEKPVIKINISVAGCSNKRYKSIRPYMTINTQINYCTR